MADLSKQDPITGVQIEALTVVKILKQCSQAYPSTTTGFLVGMDVQGVLQLTNAYSFPVSAEVPTESNHYDNQQQNSSGANAAAPRKKENIAYQNEMVRNLREVNIDANTVGWYTSANMGNFINLNFIENQFFYQRDLNERTVAIVNDVARSSVGSVSLRAFRLSPQFMLAFKENQFTTENLMKSNLRPADILVELPVRIHNSHLLTTFLHQLPVPIPEQPLEMPLSVSEIQAYADSAPLCPNLDTFDLSIDPFLEKTTDLLLDSIETHHVELNNFGYYQRALNREQAKIAAWQSKRKSENATRTITKQPLLPEDEWQRLFKLPTEPSRLEVMLNTRQVEQYSKQVDAFTASVSAKLFAVKGNLFPGGDEA